MPPAHETPVPWPFSGARSPSKRLRPRALALAGLLALLFGTPAAAATAIVMPLQVDHSDDPLLVDWNGQQVFAGELLVRFTPDALASQREAVADRVGLTHRSDVRTDVQRFALPSGLTLDEALERVRADPAVTVAQPNRAFTPTDDPDDPDLWRQWGLERVAAPAAWRGLAHGGARLAIIDSGADLDHPDLVGVVVGGYDTYSGDAVAEDLTGHGTHCAGIAGASTDNATGVAGAAWGAELLVYRCGNSVYPTSALVPAIDQAVAAGARVLSLSWGAYGNDPFITAALQDAHDAGVLIVAAAGNDDQTTLFYPAALDFVVAVASTRQNDQRSSFSNHGSWVDVAAPGQGIYSTWTAGGYTYSSGTSMACPLVAGMGALLYANLGPERSVARAAQVRAALQDTTIDVGTWLAYGRVDFEAASAALFAGAPAHISDVDPPSVQALRGATVTLTGTDMVGALGVTVAGLPADYEIVGPDSLRVTPANATALGPAPLVITKASGASTPGVLNVVATSPPRLVVPDIINDGGFFSFEFGGEPGHVGVLIVSLDSATFPYGNSVLLADLIILAVGGLDGAGLGGLAGPLPTGLAGLTFHSQIATLDAGAFVGASPPLATTIVP